MDGENTSSEDFDGFLIDIKGEAIVVVLLSIESSSV